MKKVLPLVLCALIGTHSYQQTNADKNTTISKTAGSKFSTTNGINSVVTYKGRRIYPQKAADNTIGFDGSQGFQYHAGDTIVLTAAQNPYSWASFTNIDSVTIINEEARWF